MNIFFLFLFNFVFSEAETSLANKECTIQENSQCGTVKLYWYEQIKIYSGPFENDCGVTLDNLRLNFKTEFPESTETRFLSKIGESFENLIVEKGNETMIIGIDGIDNFVWPAETLWEPFTFHILDREVTVTPVSKSPRILYVDNLLTDEEQDHLLKVALVQREKTMERSTVGQDVGKKVLDTRTSSHTWIGHERSLFETQENKRFYTDDIVKHVEEKFFHLGRSPLDGRQAETMQVVFYDENQHYFLHRDYTPADEDLSNPYHLGGGNRFATLLLYLNDVEEGGETIFPYVSPTGEPIHREKIGDLDRWAMDLCDHPEYLKVKPVKGRIAMFYNMVEKNNGENTNQSALEIYSLHMGCHVKKGQKYVSNVWLRNKEVNGKLFNQYQ